MAILVYLLGRTDSEAYGVGVLQRGRRVLCRHSVLWTLGDSFPF